MASDKALSWVFAEEFVEENELLAQAREAATDLGADPVSTGVGAALRLLAATCGAKAVLEMSGVSPLPFVHIAKENLVEFGSPCATKRDE